MIIAVPCYNEERRLRPERFLSLAAEDDITLLFVDDGSTDRTPEVLRALVARLGGKGDRLGLERNSGKAEAVRRGMLHALDRGAAVVGYVDADLSTPVEEVLRLVGEMRSRSVSVVMGARVAMLGAHIERRLLRHYVSRVFATVASLVLGIPVYDTQCGAKLFRRSDVLGDALATPFTSRWAFDVELIDRLLSGCGPHPGLAVDQFLEVPLRRWCDAGGSKLRVGGMLKAILDLLRLGLRAPRARWRRVLGMLRAR